MSIAVNCMGIGTRRPHPPLPLRGGSGSPLGVASSPSQIQSCCTASCRYTMKCSLLLLQCQCTPLLNYRIFPTPTLFWCAFEGLSTFSSLCYFWSYCPTTEGRLSDVTCVPALSHQGLRKSRLPEENGYS